jgi:hypothetical protein
MDCGAEETAGGRKKRQKKKHMTRSKRSEIEHRVDGQQGFV